ncbi:MAG: ATP-grasp domain-containing protein [Candidatus Pacebacteria bacterium]|jgi:acetyl-CoA carboxylase biotin carboxylase subunit|nr:ATP-grasp domain-containing protein [Candidatus Paceibacterota bacterium]
MQINKILIANRGEIALRILRTCRELGIKTVALCPASGQEKNFLETSLADEFYYLEKDGSAGYLDKEKIIQIAKKAGADAIHPGYGFLSESWQFAMMCDRSRVRFIGPHFKTLRTLQDKVEAKKIAKKIGIPTVPASDQSIKSKKDLIKWADRIKPPFIIKAQRGGGGMGIRVVDGTMNYEEMIALSLGVQRQMAGAFDDVDFFLEKYLPEVKHIEFQVLGDGRKAVHLGERECSIQRRFQKLVEESPSPALDPKLRAEMGAWAVKVAEHLRYQGAATVEFLLDRDKNYYFMEVNPRIQVEHPVTEAVTGVDIVEQQIRIAEGKSLAFGQESVYQNGWAIEVRVNAEDAQKNFIPSPGTVSKYIPPQGQGVFVHSFLQDGQEVYPYFDSLLAKVIAYGKDRGSAIKKLRRALSETSIEGVATTIPFFLALLEKEDFVKGDFYTNFIEKSGIVRELMLKPYACKPVACGHKDIEEGAIANIAYSIYREMKKSADTFGGGQGDVSRWVMSGRLNRMEES